MGIIKKLLLLILIFVGITAGIVIATRYMPQEAWNGTVVGPAELQPLIASSIEKAQSIQIFQGMKVLQGKVLGANETSSSSTEASSAAVEASLPQKTLDYARYTYCKAIVEEYETKQSR
jgi:hypothetical protein